MVLFLTHALDFNILYVLKDPCCFAGDAGKMDLDHKRNKKTLLDNQGQYPVWMSKRQIKKLKTKRAIKKGKPRKGIAW